MLGCFLPNSAVWMHTKRSFFQVFQHEHPIAVQTLVICDQSAVLFFLSKTIICLRQRRGRNKLLVLSGRFAFRITWVKYLRRSSFCCLVFVSVLCLSMSHLHHVFLIFSTDGIKLRLPSAAVHRPRKMFSAKMVSYFFPFQKDVSTSIHIL